MGKRSKSSSTNVIKKKSKKEEICSEEEDSKSEHIISVCDRNEGIQNRNSNLRVNDGKKAKKIIFLDETPHAVDVLENTEAVTSEGIKTHKKSKKPKQLKPTPQNNDDAIEKDSKSSKKKKNKEKQTTPEDEVKDEDIDKFCDELSEDDNVQFEDWVKLIEAKLNK